MKQTLALILYSPLILLFYLSFWYATYIDGVEPKTGQQYYKNKKIDGKTYVKKEGLRHIFNRWELVKHPSNNPRDFDINSMYPS